MKVKNNIIQGTAIGCLTLGIFIGCFFTDNEHSTLYAMGIAARRLDSLHFQCREIYPIENIGSKWIDSTLEVKLVDKTGLFRQISAVKNAPFQLPTSTDYESDSLLLLCSVKETDGAIYSDTIKPCCKYILP